MFLIPPYTKFVGVVHHFILFWFMSFMDLLVNTYFCIVDFPMANFNKSKLWGYDVYL